ncbi:hypothetical protein PIB30_073561, partial [Stylosanthes scabra]|nr:hypothetical protein [Stylosanthes scabra]
MSYFSRRSSSVLLTWLLFTTTIVVLPCALGDDGGVFGKVYLSISNKLDGNLPMTLHCKSKDNDLGVHVLNAGQSFMFSFRPSWVAQTQFYCSFAWQGGCHWFDV